ncbi:hypothetical protein JD844_000390, partial [Phrynosoma platyrhinos]
SVYEPLKSINLPRDGESLWDKLDHYYRIVKSTVLLFQNPTTGLFPTKTYGEKQKAKVHDSLYCAACAWALALAYRRIDDDKGRTHELEHSAIKCMRGILYCYMRQADKVQQFKQDPKPSKCLHSVFSAHTGDEVFSHEEYGHLQINAVSLFLLYLVEMISSGLQIIYNTDEVPEMLPDKPSHQMLLIISIILITLETRYPSYKTLYFVLKERIGYQTSVCGKEEASTTMAALNCIPGMFREVDLMVHVAESLQTPSSVGLAKAALEAINGFNLFGNQFSCHSLFRQTFFPLQNTDAALLTCISYPAFALDDEALYSQTIDKVVRKLKGKYGFKRFLRDGYRTALEDKNRQYYKPAEIKLFDGIECEFPLFFIFMIIDGVFRGNTEQVKEYQELLDPILQQSAEGIVQWFDGLVSIKDIDPVKRYIPPQDQRNVSMRYSNQGPLENDLVVHVALIAESQRLQVFLNTYGIQTQTPQQVEPIQIWAQQELVKMFVQKLTSILESMTNWDSQEDLTVQLAALEHQRSLEGIILLHAVVGVNIYRILGKTVVCYPIIFDLSDFYMSQDVMMLIDDIKNALQFIKQYWKMHGRSLFLVLIREDNIRGSRFNPILDMLASFKKGVVGGVKVHVDRLQTLISGAVVEQLDFLRIADTEEPPEFKSFEELDLPKHSKVKRQTSTPNVTELEQQPDINANDWKNRPTYEILQKLNDCNCLASQAILLNILLKREGPNFITKEGTVSDHIERIYRKAGSKKLWSVVRFAASLLCKLVDSLAPSITNVLVQGKQVTLGAFGQEEEIISNPLSPSAIKDIIYNKCNLQDEREAVLQQELVIHIGWIISNSPELFNGMLKIRVGWIVHAMKYELQFRAGEMPPIDLYQLSPSEVKQLLLDILQPQQQGRCWLNRRQIDGSLNRTPSGFYDRVWQILERTPNGLIVAGNFLPQQPTLSDMTMYEMNFSLLVEDMLKNIDQPEYRQIIVELLMVVSIILERNPELEFQDKVDLDKLVKEAFHHFQKDQNRLKGIEKQDDMTSFYKMPPLGKRGTCSYLTKAVMNALLEGEVRPSTDDPCSIS